MSLPKHKDPATPERTAHAPYNFVPLPEVVVPAPPLPERDVYDPNRFTGVIHCTLTTETPLYTRAALEPEEYSQGVKAKDKPAFFYVDPATHEPVIPGSSLRGVLREMVEIVSYSKMQPVTERQLFFRTLDDTSLGKAYGARMSGGDPHNQGYRPLVKAGYIERHQHTFFIRPAQALEGTQHYRVEESVAMRVITGLHKMARWDSNRNIWVPDRDYRWRRVPVWFKPTSPTIRRSSSAQAKLYFAEVTDVTLGNHSPGLDWVKGWFIASGWVPSRAIGKHRHWIIGPPIDDDSQRIEVDDIDIRAYREQGAGLSQTIERQKMSVLPQEESEPMPCFYTFWKDSQGRDRIAFGHTALFRLPYEWSPRDMLADYLPASSVTDIAEGLFGWVDDAKGRAIAGRVFIGDAHYAGKKDHMYLVDPERAPLRVLLSGPKPTAIQHYLVQNTDRKDILQHYQDRGKTTLRGHKLYWHKDHVPTVSDIRVSEGVTDTQLTELYPLAVGVKFEFDIHFENLTKQELGCLLWVLELGSDQEHRLKLGMGKPLGLGAIAVTSDLYLSERQERYREFWSQWQKPDAPSDKKEYVTAFETTMWDSLLPEAKGSVKDFRSLPRIQSFLALLHWPGPEDTEQMALAEFRGRPVLPSALKIGGALTKAVSRPNPGPGKEQNAERIVDAKILRVEAGHIVVLVDNEEANISFDQLPRSGKDLRERQRLYPQGELLRVKIGGRTKKGNLQVTAKGVPQE